jgi:ankyrin repeat protein
MHHHRWEFLPLQFENVEAVRDGHLLKMCLLMSVFPVLVNACDPFGETPLKIACESGRLDMVIWLISHDADVNAQFGGDEMADGGRTALMQCSSTEIARLLLNAGAEVDRIDSWGRTALMIAVESDDLERVELLLAHGADRILFDKDGKTAADKTNNPAIKSLLDARDV